MLSRNWPFPQTHPMSPWLQPAIWSPLVASSMHLFYTGGTPRQFLLLTFFSGDDDGALETRMELWGRWGAGGKRGAYSARGDAGGDVLS